MRSALLIIVGLVLATLAALNLDELMRPAELNLGWRTVDAPLGLVLAALAALALLLAAAVAAFDQVQLARQRSELERQLQVQRDLADMAEGSRLAQVQRHLDLQAQAAQHRERELRVQLGEQLAQVQHSLQRQIDDVGNSLAAYIGELEDRLERRHLLRRADEEAGRPPYPPQRP